MPSPQVLDFEQLLEPISEDAPAGIDLRSDAKTSQIYYAVKDARSAARSKERNSLIEDGEAHDLSADWRPVLKQAQTLIGQHSKDLEVTAWLIEALVRLHGFAGLRDGFRLARELSERFWDGIYPRPDEDGIETTVAPLSGLNGEDGEGTLIAPIRGALITGGQSVGPFAMWHYEQAVALEQITDSEKRERRIADGAVTLQQIRQAAAETPATEFMVLREDLQEALAEFQQLSAALDERCGPDAPPSSNIRNMLQSCDETLMFLAGDKLGTSSDAEADPASPDADSAPATAAPSAAPAPGQIRGREDAFKILLDVADFFRRTEPHSPLSYSLEQAVRWGRMPLPDLLADLINDTSARDEFFRVTGIPRPDESD
ncbi:MAG: type VI secretion system protein TssA [Gammaproteobacteria bacterium]